MSGLKVDQFSLVGYYVESDGGEFGGEYTNGGGEAEIKYTMRKPDYYNLYWCIFMTG